MEEFLVFSSAHVILEECLHVIDISPICNQTCGCFDKIKPNVWFPISVLSHILPNQTDCFQLWCAKDLGSTGANLVPKLGTEG
jgi:hypothetical protein